jgi:hypothetical protein
LPTVSVRAALSLSSWPFSVVRRIHPARQRGDLGVLLRQRRLVLGLLLLGGGAEVLETLLVGLDLGQEPGVTLPRLLGARLGLRQLRLALVQLGDDRLHPLESRDPLLTVLLGARNARIGAGRLGRDGLGLGQLAVDIADELRGFQNLGEKTVLLRLGGLRLGQRLLQLGLVATGRRHDGERDQPSIPHANLPSCLCWVTCTGTCARDHPTTPGLMPRAVVPVRGAGSPITGTRSANESQA